MPMLFMDTAREFDYITYDPHDRVRENHYCESGGNSRTAYIRVISTRHEIEELRAAGAYVDADTMEAALEHFFFWKAVSLITLCRRLLSNLFGTQSPIIIIVITVPV